MLKPRHQPIGVEESPELLRERVDSLFRLMEVTSLISSTLDLDEVLMRVMELSKEMMDAEAASIMLWNESLQCLEFQTTVGEVGVEQLKTIHVPKGQGIAGTVAETGEPMLVADVTKDERFFAKADEQTGFITKSILAAPLIVQDRIVGVGEVLNHRDGRPFTELDLELFASFCRQVAVAIENARLHQEEVKRQLIEQQMQMAASIQKSFLPAELPNDPGGRYELAAFTKSAQAVGGDLYSVTLLADGRIGICVGDVSGKGIPAALYMARVVTEFRLSSAGGAAADEVLRGLNKGLVEAPMRGMFVTFSYVILDPATGELCVSNAGHLPLVISAPDGTARWVVEASGPPLGMLPVSRYREERLRLSPGEAALLFSDGVVEARSRKGDLYENERLREVVARHGGEGAGSLLSGVLHSLEDFTRGAAQADDMTLLSVSWTG